jgi:hypothetical protein
MAARVLCLPRGQPGAFRAFQHVEQLASVRLRERLCRIQGRSQCTVFERPSFAVGRRASQKELLVVLRRLASAHKHTDNPVAVDAVAVDGACIVSAENSSVANMRRLGMCVK